MHETSLTPPRPRWHRLLRHLEGWQLGVVAVGMALLVALLVIPRPVRPRELPLPEVDRVEQRRASAEDLGRIERAEQTPLPFLVRAVGEAARAFGAAEADGSSEAVRLARDLTERAREAKAAHGAEPLLALRAVQAALFARAVLDGGEGAKGPTPELKELGGAFTKRLADSPELGDRLDAGELEALFSVRWSRLTGLIDARPFAPSLNQWRLYYGALLRHPELYGEKKRSRRLQAQLATVVALGRIDPDYPLELGRGVLEYQLGNPASAVKLFRAHLLRHPEGAYRLRAQNYLVKALQEVAHAGPTGEE